VLARVTFVDQYLRFNLFGSALKAGLLVFLSKIERELHTSEGGCPTFSEVFVVVSEAVKVNRDFTI
jgi:hypothetical protein